MTNTIKPIETSYKGYRFRSRLEARWAVYFDALKLGWDYEPQGFNLGGGVCYLPDFWIHTLESWAEVKAHDFTSEERRKVRLLVNSTNYPCLLLVGTPGSIRYAQVLPKCKDYEYVYVIDYWDSSYWWNRVEQGVIAARSARFEHGENPWQRI